MPDIEVDIAIIGAGTAGMRAYREVSPITAAMPTRSASISARRGSTGAR